MNGPLETDDMLVVTLRMPTDDVQQLAVSVCDGRIRVLGPNGFRRHVALPKGADADRLQAGLFFDVLELRAPRSAAARTMAERQVSVRPLGGGPPTLDR